MGPPMIDPVADPAAGGSIKAIELSGLGYVDKVPDQGPIIAFRDALRASEFFSDETEISWIPEQDEFTAVGIGDMGGDVFGNGMIEHRTLKLQAAFNHLHIFLDPDPDPAVAFKERKRLFRAKLEIDAHYTLQQPLRWWLYTHLPVSFVVLALLALHLYTVLFY